MGSFTKDDNNLLERIVAGMYKCIISKIFLSVSVFVSTRDHSQKPKNHTWLLPLLRLPHPVSKSCHFYFPNISQVCFSLSISLANILVLFNIISFMKNWSSLLTVLISSLAPTHLFCFLHPEWTFYKTHIWSYHLPAYHGSPIAFVMNSRFSNLAYNVLHDLLIFSSWFSYITPLKHYASAT